MYSKVSHIGASMSKPLVVVMVVGGKMSDTVGVIHCPINQIDWLQQQVLYHHYQVNANEKIIIFMMVVCTQVLWMCNRSCSPHSA